MSVSSGEYGHEAIETALRRLVDWLRIICFVLILGGAASHAQNIPAVQTGRIYDLKQRTRLLFLFERQVEGPPDMQHVVVRFFSPGGKELVHEEVDYRGARFQRYTVDKLQTGEHAEIVVNNGKIRFRYRDKNRKEKRNTETWDESVIVIDELPRFIQQNWTSLKAKKSVPFRFVVPQRAGTVGFELSASGATTCRNLPALRIRMQVRNAFARLFASAMTTANGSTGCLNRCLLHPFK